MDSRYARPTSPGSRRISTQPTRSSTGTLVYPSSYDPYYSPARSSGNVAAGPRVSNERVGAPRVIPMYRPKSPPQKTSRDDYAVRPRRLTLDTREPATRRPLSMIGPTSPSRNRPIVTSAIDRPGSPLSKPSRVRPDEGYYLQPASSMPRREHRRGYTVGSTKDSDRLTTGSRDARDRMERGGYRSSGIGGGRSVYYPDQPLARSKDDHAYGYDYNDRREQMYRDLAPKPRPRRDSYNATTRERPTSITGIEDLKRVPVPSREAGPPVSRRGFDGLGRASSVRQDRAPREEYLPREYAREGFDRPNQKHSRAQVALHQVPDDRYAPYPPDKDYEVRQPRPPKPVVEPKSVVEPRAVVEPRPVTEERLERHEPKPRDPHDDRYDRGGEDHSRRHERIHRDRDPVDERDRRREDDREHRRETRHRDVEPSDSRDYRKDDRHRDIEPLYDRETRKEERRRDPEPIDDRGSRKEHRHRERRDRGDDGHRGDAAILGAAGVAAGGMAAAEGVRQHRAHRDDRDRLAAPSDPSESNSVRDSAEGSDEERRRDRHRRRRREREERELHHAEDRKRHDPDDLGVKEAEPPRDREVVRDLAPPREEGSLRQSASYERPSHSRQVSSSSVNYDKPSQDQQVVPGRSSSHTRRRHHYPRTQDKDSYSESSGSDSDLDNRPRQVRVVTPTNEPVEPKEPPKSILRQPRERFPEDPAPVREGVAPLKDAGKKGIPPNARWTKIDRKLVNPEALDAGNERYEERTDFVIVLRVLTKEEIEQYALKTQEIRGKRAEGRDDEASSRDS